MNTIGQIITNYTQMVARGANFTYIASYLFNIINNCVYSAEYTKSERLIVCDLLKNSVMGEK